MNDWAFVVAMILFGVAAIMDLGLLTGATPEVPAKKLLVHAGLVFLAVGLWLS